MKALQMLMSEDEAVVDADMLRRANERYRRTFENAPIGMAEVAASGHLVMCNAQFRALVGRSARELVGRHFTELLEPSDVMAALEAFTAALHGELPPPYQRRYTRPDGTVTRAEVAISPAAPDGADGSIIVLVKDVTERIAFEEQLRASKEQLDDAQQTSNIGSWEYDFATGRRTFSDNLLRMYGFPPGERLDASVLYALMPAEERDRVRAEIEAAYATFSPFSLQFRIVAPDGVPRTLQAVGRTAFDPEGRPLRASGTVQDITARVAGDEELHRVAVQQAAVANLSQIALSGASLESLFTQVSALICNVLGLVFWEVLQ
jgi:PAS domain S-box-containing protein